jgi:hypothetical protein
METTDLLKHLLTTKPGPLPIALLEGIDRAELDSDARLDYAKAWDRQQRWVANRAEQVCAQMAGNRRQSEGPPSV